MVPLSLTRIVVNHEIIHTDDVHNSQIYPESKFKTKNVFLKVWLGD